MNRFFFQGTALDENVSATDLTVVFTSDKDGELGVGTVSTSGTVIFETDQLSNNTHVMSMNVTDDVGAQCQDTLVVYVGTPPIVEIVEPQNGDVFTVGSNVLFTGSITDTEDQSTDLLVSWDASLVGELRSGYPDSQGASVCVQYSSSRFAHHHVIDHRFYWLEWF